ncbi:MAG TPA: Mut7-C RNAse domain-containing protein [Candidatus Binatia bacterium]|nr:Mut7-C RNAse domain-containing protein [Candidatus Binatia bacterium]
MLFVADKMLGRLARWLRIMGQDVAYGPELSGAGLLRAARQQGRLILTRDRTVAKRNPPPYLMIRSDHFREQLRQVIEECALDPLKDAFTRCAECNTALESVAKSAIEDKVPPYVFATQQEFSLCPGCRRVYWPATHQERMLDELQSLSRK